MSLAIVAKGDPNGVTVVDSQTVLVRIPCGLITLNFDSPEQMMAAAEAMAFFCTLVVDPSRAEPTRNNIRNNTDNQVIVIDGTPLPPPLRNRTATKIATISTIQEPHMTCLLPRMRKTMKRLMFELAAGVRRVDIDNKKDDSFEETYGLTQEF
jgi:hypothetical protein